MHPDAEADESIRRIGAALRPLPDVDPSRVAQLLVAVAAERERDREALQRTRRLRRWASAGGGLAAATVLAALLLRSPDAGVPGAGRSAARGADVAASSPAGGPPGGPPGGAATATTQAVTPQTRLAAGGADEVAALPVQLVFRAPSARRVSVVGDFNGWDARATTMTRDHASGLWSQTLLLRPGRHVYAFVVDDSIWARDPALPPATDPDFGRPGSVLLVGRP